MPKRSSLTPTNRETGPMRNKALISVSVRTLFMGKCWLIMLHWRGEEPFQGIQTMQLNDIMVVSLNMNGLNNIFFKK